MVASFAKAPLIEIIAELSWPPGEAKDGEVDTAGETEITGETVAAAESEALEKFFDDFGAEVEAGFPRSERMLPTQLPHLVHAVIHRFMPPRASKLGSSTFLQVGPGIFSANALQPYRTWKEFQPSLETGVRALLKASPDDKPFRLSLRYVNAFDKDLFGGRTATAFITDVLGFRVEVPTAVSKLAAEGQTIRPVIQTKLKTGEKTILSINVGEGRVGGRRAVVLDWMMQVADVERDMATVMDQFSLAHETMHDLFSQMTTPIHDLMQPKED